MCADHDQTARRTHLDQEAETGTGADPETGARTAADPADDHTVSGTCTEVTIR